ncbi:MAG: TIGR00725 family protein [Candidatus Lokiarchaeota archaeon]|nr:TIGR00725 family protein [Candidatus Lokiarchaeota archaeon]MBD3202488.1 TIGR00725 family protein [Candidatus Lokiarchaeota archaeon]
MAFQFKEQFKAIISVICGSEIDKNTEKKAVEIGKLLAKNNFAIACGGLFGGMEAVCKGAKQENGFTVGIVPSKKKSVANKYVDIAIPVPFSQARNLIVVLTGDACVAIGGKAGTLSEICFAWIYQKPIIALSSVEGWSNKLADKKIDERRSDKIYDAKTPQDVIRYLNELLKVGFSSKTNLDFIDKF